VDIGGGGLDRPLSLQADGLKIAVGVALIAGQLGKHELVGVIPSIGLALPEFSLLVSRNVVGLFSGSGKKATPLVEDAPNARQQGGLVAIVRDCCLVRR
jgi:hypothetical protein